MIPKIIHYCWFGGKEKPKDVIEYISSWKKYCPDYIIKEWNESNFDIHCCRYVEQAYECKKWAFVSDVARIYALYHEGGIYLDTDVEIIKPLDCFLQNKGFLGFEGTQWIATNIIGVVPKNELIEQFLKSYLKRIFVREDGNWDMTTNVEVWTKLLNEKGLVLDGMEQQVDEFRIYPSDYFSPYDYIQGKMRQTNNTYTIHWFSQSWIKQNSLRRKFSQWYHRLFGVKM